MRIEFSDPGVNVFNEMLYAFVLKPYRIQHTTCGFSHPGVRIAIPVLQGKAFYENASQAAYIKEVEKLFAVTKGSGSSTYRVLKL